MANHVLGYGRLRNGYAKLRQLAVHSGGAPERIRPTHGPDQLANLRSDARSTWATFPTLPSPIASEPGTVPPDHGLGLYDEKDTVPVSPDSAQPHPETTVDTR